MPRSSIPRVKAALVAALDVALPDDDLVTWGNPRGSKPREWVMVGNVRGLQRAAAQGRQRRKEHYVIEVQVTVTAADTADPQEIADRAFDIAAEIEELLRADESLGDVEGLITAEVVKTDLTEGMLAVSAGQTSGERMAEVMVHVACETRI